MLVSSSERQVTAECYTRRTDGKKWWCSRAVVPHQKYCKRHMHRGANKPLNDSSNTVTIAFYAAGNTACTLPQLTTTTSLERIPSLWNHGEKLRPSLMLETFKLRPSLLQPPSHPTKALSRRGCSHTGTILPAVQSIDFLILEGMIFKLVSAKAWNGRIKETAQGCKNMLDSEERIFSIGITKGAVDKKCKKTIGYYKEAVAAYNHTLLTQWSLDNENFARMQKGFAIFLLYRGFEVGTPSPAVLVDGLYIHKNKLEETILLLMVLMRKFYLGKIKWDPSIMEHLTFALSVCCQTSLSAKEYEELVPGVIHRIDQCKALSFCHTGAEQNSTALNLLRKSLHKYE
ncbi:WRC domain [Dillenia turbinata]|uniref:WRC domain n=1 Tax=Dillenia turbinata TaxID=194707 RepID=A0AAN8UNI3_9MAGN